MNFFEQELKKIMNHVGNMDRVRYVGRVCYGVVSADLRIRIEFVTTSTIRNDQYNAVELAVISPTKDNIDSVTLYFSDILKKGEKGSTPYISRFMADEQYRWYDREPNDDDYKVIAAQIDDYLWIFQS